MDGNVTTPAYRDRSMLLKVIGWLMLAGGIAIGLLGPLEMYCYYLFSEGGRFQYDGFGFGSFMFANLTGQITGYYLIAGLSIVLGYGHLNLRRWAGRLTMAVLWAWLVIGAPMTVVVFLVLVGSKDLSLPAGITALVILAASYFVAPALLLRFYHGRNVRHTFSTHDATQSRLAALPVPILALALLYGFYIVMFHLLILFNGIYPWFGIFRFGMQGIVLIDISIACLAGLLWGTLRQRVWAWWGAVVLVGATTLSTILTFMNTTYPALLAGLAFPPSEVDFLDGIPAHGWHFAFLTGIPLLATWLLVLASRRHFGVEAGTFEKIMAPANGSAPGKMEQNIIHVALVVRDYDEAIAFYCNKLHFTLVEDTYQPGQDKRWVVVAPPGAHGTSLLLARASTPGQQAFIGNQAGGRVFLFLATDDFWRDYNEMLSIGIRFIREPKTESYGTVAVFEDLYGNRWDLIQPGQPLTESDAHD